MSWHLVTVYVIAESMEDALRLIREPGSVARTDYPLLPFDTDPDEIDAYAFSIAIELLRHMHKDRAKRYLTRIKTLAKMRIDSSFVSPNLKAYIDHFGLNDNTKNLAKKVYKHLDTVDKGSIFM